MKEATPEQIGAELYFLMAGILTKQGERELHPNCGQDGFAESLWPYAKILAEVGLGDEGGLDVFSYAISEDIAADVYIEVFDNGCLCLEAFERVLNSRIKKWQGLTEKKYTPGPWMSFNSSIGGSLLIKPEGPHQVICEMDPTLNRENDARLIKAAPDMFETLQKIYEGDLEPDDQGVALLLLKAGWVAPRPVELKESYEEILKTCEDQRRHLNRLRDTISELKKQQRLKA